MSEEEAIEWAKELLQDKEKYAKYHSWVGTNTFVSIQILLNLIDKQEKEIEELKENQIAFKEMKEELKPLIKGEYISKDKIRELKKEVDENGENENVGFYKLYDGIEELLEEE